MARDRCKSVSKGFPRVLRGGFGTDEQVVPDSSAPPVSRRHHPRFQGPFDGRRGELLPVPLRIFDLSVGGCLIESHQEQLPGRRFSLEIELPVEGWLQFEAQVLYNRDGWFAVHFVEMSGTVRTRLDRALARLTPAPGPGLG